METQAYRLLYIVGGRQLEHNRLAICCCGRAYSCDPHRYRIYDVRRIPSLCGTFCRWHSAIYLSLHLHLANIALSRETNEPCTENVVEIVASQTKQDEPVE